MLKDFESDPISARPYQIMLHVRPLLRAGFDNIVPLGIRRKVHLPEEHVLTRL